jgi:regulatory protein
MNKELFELYDKATSFCSKSERCISEVNQYLSKYCKDFDMISEVSLLLVKEKYIDEQRYAKAFTNDKFKFSGWGKIKISYMLRQKNIDSENISYSLDLIDDEIYCDFLKNLLQKKFKTLKNKDSEQSKAALIRFAISRGFEFEIVLKAIKMMNF